MVQPRRGGELSRLIAFGRRPRLLERHDVRSVLGEGGGPQVLRGLRASQCPVMPMSG